MRNDAAGEGRVAPGFGGNDGSRISISPSMMAELVGFDRAERLRKIHTRECGQRCADTDMRCRAVSQCGYHIRPDRADCQAGHFAQLQSPRLFWELRSENMEIAELEFSQGCEMMHRFIDVDPPEPQGKAESPAQTSSLFEQKKLEIALRLASRPSLLLRRRAAGGIRVRTTGTTSPQCSRP